MSLKAVEVDVYDRGNDWKKRAVTSLGDALALPALALSILLADIYLWTSLARNEK